MEKEMQFQIKSELAKRRTNENDEVELVAAAEGIDTTATADRFKRKREVEAGDYEDQPACKSAVITYQCFIAEEDLLAFYDSLSIENLKIILKKNEQPMTGRKPDLIARCVTGHLYGKLPHCELCGGNLRIVAPSTHAVVAEAGMAGGMTGGEAIGSAEGTAAGAASAGDGGGLDGDDKVEAVVGAGAEEDEAEDAQLPTRQVLCQGKWSPWGTLKCPHQKTTCEIATSEWTLDVNKPKQLKDKIDDFVTGKVIIYLSKLVNDSNI